jgi:hypothetical protein
MFLEGLWSSEKSYMISGYPPTPERLGDDLSFSKWNLAGSDSIKKPPWLVVYKD